MLKEQMKKIQFEPSRLAKCPRQKPLRAFLLCNNGSVERDQTILSKGELQ
jgi:hypothetical protein